MRGLLSYLKKSRTAMAAVGVLTVLAGTTAITGTAVARDGHGHGDRHGGRNWDRGDRGHRDWDRGRHHHYHRHHNHYRPAQSWGYYYAPPPVYRTYYPSYYNRYYYDPGPSVNFGFVFR